MALILGGFVFTDYAIPEQVGQGGSQKLAVHKLIGGTRVIDAMGPDDADISWSGRFQGSGATAQAMALDMMRKSGAQLPLIVDSQYYTVVVSKFSYDYQRPYQIPYSITCMVASSMGGGFGLLDTLDALVSGDLGAAAGLVAGL